MPVRFFFRFCLALSACLPAALPMTAHAQTAPDGAALARARNCLGCHQADRRMVGPSYQSVAERYAGQAGAVEHLAQSIRKGSARRWGAIPMPAQSAVSEAEARQLAEWILATKKK